jgi:RimJ/RimL family protein N-acetyltransferase
MKTGEIIKTFTAKDGRKVILRTPKWEDLDDFLEAINSLVDEGVDILRTQRVSRDEEIDWLSRVLSHMERGEMVYLVAEVDGKVEGLCEMSKRNGRESHVGVIGIAIKRGFREASIGTEMMKTLIEHAPLMGVKVLTLTTFATNKRAFHVYEKVGFVETGRIPRKFFKDGNYVDEVILTKVLE